MLELWSSCDARIFLSCCCATQKYRLSLLAVVYITYQYSISTYNTNRPINFQKKYCNTQVMGHKIMTKECSSCRRTNSLVTVYPPPAKNVVVMPFLAVHTEIKPCTWTANIITMSGNPIVNRKYGFAYIWHTTGTYGILQTTVQMDNSFQ